jgi:hypothetical protein
MAGYKKIAPGVPALGRTFTSELLHHVDSENQGEVLRRDRDRSEILRLAEKLAQQQMKMMHAILALHRITPAAV